MMKEEFLHFVWRHRLFTSEYAMSERGERIHIVDVGTCNHDAGPDFFNARIRIDGVLWAGNVEIHLRASDWTRHGHCSDPAYENVILHVVQEADKEIYGRNGRIIPCICLEYSELLLKQYQSLLESKQWIPCETELRKLDSFFLNSWLDRMLVERLERKAEGIINCLKRNKNSWEDSFYQHLARNFGMKVNAEPFGLLARSLPLKILARQKNSLIQLEALLFGQAGFLSGKIFEDDYAIQLQREYEFLKQKYSLKPMLFSHWKFMRLRPNNFPTIRIAQFAFLINHSRSLFSYILETNEIVEIKKMFFAGVSDYWKTHYIFDKPAAFSNKIIGDSFLDLLLINTVIPFLFVYGRFHKKCQYEERAINFLNSIKAENNQVIRRWREMGIQPASAFYSQALLQLKTEYCDSARCLECEMGNRIIRTTILSKNQTE
ncbi:MAG: DUF2851 family protein [Marinifilaceae bacterium]